MKLIKKLTIVLTALLCISPIITIVPTQVTSAAHTEKNKLGFIGSPYIYKKSGKRYRYYNQIAQHLFTDTDVNGYNYIDGNDTTPITSFTGKTITIKGQKYYEIAKNAYIKAANVLTLNGKNIKKGKLTLNHKSRLYTKNGHKTKKELAADSIVSYAGKVKKKNTCPKYFYYTSTNKYAYLPTKRIKGHDYYALKNHLYINAQNIGTINGEIARLNGVTYATVTKSSRTQTISNGLTDHKLVKGQKVKIDMAVAPWSEDFDGYIYHLHNYPKEYIDEGYIKIRNDLPITDYNDMAYTYFKPVNGNQITTYKVDGSTAQTLTIKDNNEPTVDAKLYLWVERDHQAELFYHILHSDSDSEQTADDTVPDYSNSFVKASDIKITGGVKLTSLNSAKDAQADNVVATDANKQELRQLFAKGQQNLADTYTDAILRQNYDNALTIAASVIRSTTASLGEVKEATWLLKTTEDQLSELYFEPWS
ncbi:SLAP domain-containing protein [Lactobacillus sp. ESL0731]|uniref:SLAP domain-containing protein n=1 Tax=unclassified Lactobacillus TaxID=2620435 RepID=UPI0023F72BC5|nr:MULTISPECIES: SLAP domain-containing protein [unclassified Lactobacillus]WEV51229.1 SLAP domain-containing protein [Lactobacillus sp. ESL0700]WEV62359.1 SLAP domain-containing protein [Lactobacillus sp. ESL0731]